MAVLQMEVKGISPWVGSPSCGERGHARNILKFLEDEIVKENFLLRNYFFYNQGTLDFYFRID